MKAFSSREIISLLAEAGWRLHKVVGSHHQFVHAERTGKVTVPHPCKDLPLKTVRSIFRQAAIDWRELN
jgi:predicted RNA binding protein YcfA (HicA-like mRNA interferase family)